MLTFEETIYHFELIDNYFSSVIMLKFKESHPLHHISCLLEHKVFVFFIYHNVKD